MKYLKEYNSFFGDVSIASHELIDDINDALQELNDKGFVGNALVNSPVKLYCSVDRCAMTILKPYLNGLETYRFGEIKDTIYRIKDIVGIDNIYTFVLYDLEDRSHTRIESLRDENINDDLKIKMCYMIFNFQLPS